MAVLNIDDTQFSKIQQVNFTTSGKISSDKYVIDENNNIVFNDPIINAIDIDWNNAKHPKIDKTINTSGDLINVIGNLSSSVGDINEIVNNLEIPKSVYDLNDSSSLLTIADIESLKPQLTGKSAYELARDSYEATYGVGSFPYRTVESWVASLKGEQGQRGFPGINGKSAYDSAQTYYQTNNIEFPYQNEYEWIQDIINGNETKAYTDEKTAQLNELLSQKILDNVTTLNQKNEEHIEVKLIETQSTITDLNGNELTVYNKPYKYDIILKDIASADEVNSIKLRLDTFASTELINQIDERINRLIGGASEEFDTLKEIEQWISEMPMTPTQMSTKITDLLNSVNDLTGELTEEKLVIDDQGNTSTIIVPKTYDNGQEYGTSLEEINDTIKTLLSTVSTAKDVQDGAEANVIDNIIGKLQTYTINGETVSKQFITVDKPENTKIVELGIDTNLLNDLITENNTTIINTTKNYVDEKMSWNIVD